VSVIFNKNLANIYIHKFFGGVFFVCGLLLAGWVFYNLFIERLPATQGQNPAPAIISAILLLLAGYRNVFGKKYNSKSFKRSYESVIMLWVEPPKKILNKIKVTYGDSEAYAALMEFSTAENKKVIVMAGSIGDGSVYFESNNADGVGGWIGGVTHEHIKNSAICMVKMAEEKTTEMRKIDNFTHVAPQNVRFTILGKKDKYAAEFIHTDVQQEQHPFYRLYAAGQDIITGYRLMDANRK